jgi:hypothetical protein
MTCGSLQGSGDTACWPVEVDREPGRKRKASAQVTPPRSPPAGARLNSITAQGIEANGCLSKDGPAGLHAVPRLAVPTGCQSHSRSGPHWITRLTAPTVVSHRGTSDPSATAMGAMGCFPVL